MGGSNWFKGFKRPSLCRRELLVAPEWHSLDPFPPPVSSDLAYAAKKIASNLVWGPRAGIIPLFLLRSLSWDGRLGPVFNHLPIVSF